MGLHVSVDGVNKKADVWICLDSGCATYVESEHFAEASIDDRRKDGIRITKSVSLRRREGCIEVIHDIMNNNTPTVGNEPKADEEELLEAFKFVIDKITKGMRYVGVKTEFTTPRGIQVYFRLRFNELSGGLFIIVELTAEKEGERVVYHAFGQTSNVYAIREEAARAIGTYVLFSEYVAKQTDQQNDQR
jgi:hypothetical protein